MSGKKFLLDTNIILYILGDKFDLSEIPDGHFYISIITEIELLSYPKLESTEEESIRQFLNMIDIINLNTEIKEKTIYLRKKYNLKLPDAIISATAYSIEAELITNDKQLCQITEIKSIFTSNII